MKKYLLTAFILGFMVCLSSSEAMAQKQQKLIVDIPFEFTVMDKKFDAGRYVISRLDINGAPEILHFRRYDDSKAQMILTLQQTDGASKYRQIAVKFNRYGDKYFLSAIFNSGEGFGGKIIKSKTEIQTAKEFENRKAEVASVVLSKDKD